MFYALLIVCAMTEPVCNADHALLAEKSPAIFADETECRRGAMLRLMEVTPLIPGYEQRKLYHMDVRCERATPQEGA